MTARLYAIPDIHGRFDLLSSLWQTLLTDEKLDLTQDRVVFLGDMIDRGPQSREVIEMIKGLTETHGKHVIALRGNHESLCLDALKDTEASRHAHAMELWSWNGGGATLRSFPNRTIPEETLEWLRLLPLHYRGDTGFFFSHAPAPAENHRAYFMRGQPYSLKELTWTYVEGAEEADMATFHPADVIGVCGHIHALSRGILAPRFYEHYIFADAGCGCHPDAPLVAIEVRSRKVIWAWPGTPPLPRYREMGRRAA